MIKDLSVLSIKSFQKLLLILFICSTLFQTAVFPKVKRIEIKKREAVTISHNQGRSGQYEILKGIIYFEVDPGNKANKQIVDLQYGKLNEQGMVEFSTKFELHKPINIEQGNDQLIYFVNNRGNKIGQWHFNHNSDKNWLYSRGYSYMWCGWNCDVPESDRKLNINVPVITNNGEEITGKIYAEMISFYDEVIYSRPIVWGGSIPYKPVSMDNSNAKLTKRQYRDDDPIEIPSTNWKFGFLEEGKFSPDSRFIYIKEGFKPGWLYDLVYTGKNPKITGLGMVAIRDVVSFFKYEKDENRNPLAGNVKQTYAWGHSQSGRLLNHFVYQNFNGDENNQQVFDGIISNCPGGGKGLFNSRFAQFTRHGSHHEDNLFPIDFFPFASVEQTDPVSGKTGDSFSEAKNSGFMPKIMFVNSSTDYWTRAASLLHTNVEGTNDIKINENVRIYSIAGRAHTSDRIGIINRALLTNLHDWVNYGIKPPVSQIPKIVDGTLVSLENFNKNFPKIPNVIIPQSYYEPFRLDMGPRWETEGIADNVPPVVGPKYVCLVPQVDKNGNEIAGIRLPEIEVPLATFTGWRMRNPAFSNSLGRNSGTVYPFPQNMNVQMESNDPRETIYTLYPTKKDYLNKITNSLIVLNQKRFLLDEDIPKLFMEAAQYDYWPTLNEKPEVNINQISVAPSEIKPGDKSLITVTFEGKLNNVIFTKALFRNLNNFDFLLNNNGFNGDAIADDNIWSCEILIPEDFPSKDFTIDLSCLDKNFNHIYFSELVKKDNYKDRSVLLSVQ